MGRVPAFTDHPTSDPAQKGPSLVGSDPTGRESDRVIISRLIVSNDGQRIACVAPLENEGHALVVLLESNSDRASRYRSGQH